MGVVYRARELALDRERALKVLPTTSRVTRDSANASVARRRLAASVEHPNVVTVHQAGEEGGLPFISMSLVPGPDLGVLVDTTGPLSPPGQAT